MKKSEAELRQESRAIKGNGLGTTPKPQNWALIKEHYYLVDKTTGPG